MKLFSTSRETYALLRLAHDTINELDCVAGKFIYRLAQRKNASASE